MNRYDGITESLALHNIEYLEADQLALGQGIEDLQSAIKAFERAHEPVLVRILAVELENATARLEHNKRRIVDWTKEAEKQRVAAYEMSVLLDRKEQ